MTFQKGQNFWLGKHHSEETKKKIGNANKGKIRSEESKLKNREKHLGKKYSKERKENISKGSIGKKMSNEAKEKMKQNHWMKKESYTPEKNGRWRGDAVGYIALHLWIKKNKPNPINCEICKERKKLELSNISGKYKRDVNDFQWVCKKCHCKFDKENFGREVGKVKK